MVPQSTLAPKPRVTGIRSATGAWAPPPFRRRVVEFEYDPDLCPLEDEDRWIDTYRVRLNCGHSLRVEESALDNFLECTECRAVAAGAAANPVDLDEMP